eukprot:g5979.t1
MDAPETPTDPKEVELTEQHVTPAETTEANHNRRDRQIKVDTLVDFLCTALPILLMWFGYNVPISVQDMIQIAFFPAFMMLMKLDTILEEIIRSRTADATLEAQEKTATRASRRRKSLYRGLSHFEIAEQQQAAVPRAVHMGAAGCKFAFGLTFLIIAIVQLVVQNEIACEPLLWKSCMVKTPFCGNAFTPTCNCVVLNVRKHNWTTLPNDIQEMNALKVMQINHGPLEVIPDGLDKKFSKVSVLDLSYNELAIVPESLGIMKFNVLKLANNKLNSLPDDVWGNKNVFSLELDNNNVSEISPKIKYAISLRRLFLSNNTLFELPDEIFEKLYLISFYVDGNKLSRLSKSINQLVTLSNFQAHNNYLSKIPQGIGNLGNLYDIDLRNNTITSLPTEFGKLRKSIKFVYLHNNPVCINGWLEKAPEEIQNIINIQNQGCSPQCSIYCQDRFIGDKTCSRECNSAICQFDKGDCD